MRKKSIWLIIGMLVATLLFAVAGCKTKTDYKLSETSISLTVGEEKQLTISPDPTAKVNWESDDEDVATVANGVVLAVGAGSATVSAKIEGVDAPLACTVTVSEEQTEVNGYRLDFSSVSLKTGETLQISVLNEEGHTAQATYSSTDPAVATVSESGLITAVGNGEALIRAQIEGGTLVCKVTVAQAYTYALDKTTLDVAVGASGQLTLITTPGGSATNRPHTFSSSNTDVVTVTGGTGKLTGVAKGTAVITCLVDGQELKATVNVTEYTMQINEVTAYDGMELGFAENYTITIHADPERDVPATSYASSDESILTIANNGKITLNRTGDVTISAEVAGVTLTADVKVVSDYSINHEEYALTYGSTDNTVRLSVMDGANEYDGDVTYESFDENIATVSEDGVVTATGIGTTKIKINLTETFYFETEITVKFGVEQSEVDYANGVNYSVNLDALEETENVTLDWRYYGKDGYTDRKNGGNLIGDYTGEQGGDFFDYRVKMNWSDGTTTPKSFADRTDGRTFKNISFTVKVTKDVEYIAIFTGVYHGTNTVTISYNGVVCASVTFENRGNNDSVDKNKQIIFTPDVENLIGDEMEFTITMVVGPESSNGWADNVSLVAVAVVGNEERPYSGPSAETVTNVTKTEVTANYPTFDLSAIGNEDWVYSKNGNPGTAARKAGVSNVILEDEIEYSANPSGGDRYANGTFKWIAADATAAPAGATVNNFLWVNVSYTIPVHLSEGEHVVTLYLSGWNCAYLVKVVDGNGNTILSEYQLTEHTGSDNHAFEVKIPLNVLAEDTFLFTMSRGAGSPGNGNHGWAAIAVSQESEFSITSGTELNLVKDSASMATATIETGTDGLAYFSADTSIATVDENGLITAVGAGVTYIRVTDGETEERVFVTVTEYMLTSDASLTLSVGATFKIEITANPASEVELDVYPGEEENSVAWVDAEGYIHAKKSGTVKITVTVGGVSFDINVTVVGYQISDTSATLHAGNEVAEQVTLKVYNESDLTQENPLNGITWNSSNPNVAEVGEATGVVKAMGTGSAIITGHLEGGATVTCEITVLIPEITEENVTTVERIMDVADLTRASDTYKTIDYKHWYANDPVVEMPGRETLIGDAVGSCWGDWGATFALGYGFKATTEGSNRSFLQNAGTSYTKVFGSGFTIPITVNKKVSEIILYIGGWNTTATVTFKLGDRTLDQATYTFSVEEVSGGKGRKITLALDTAKMLSAETLTVQVANAGGNVTLVGIAVAGTQEHDDALQATATATVENIEGDGHKLVNLTEVGSYDWLYSHYENPHDTTFRKFNGHNVFTGETYYDNQGNVGDVGILWNGKAAFKWTDGVMTGSDATEGTVNPVDNDGSWDAGATGGVDGYTNNCFVKNGEVHIKMHLAQGKFVITAYLYSKNAPIGASIYDGNNNFVVGKQLYNNDYDGVKCWAVTYTIDVKETGDFTLVVGKVRSHGDSGREVGWQAIAVSEIND